MSQCANEDTFWDGTRVPGDILIYSEHVLRGPFIRTDRAGQSSQLGMTPGEGLGIDMCCCLLISRLISADSILYSNVIVSLHSKICIDYDAY